MPQGQPLTTCVIPCHNHGSFVADAANSCLAQADAAVEVVVIDDGSDDGKTPRACDALEALGVRVVHQANAGLPAARNAGAALARGQYLVFLDADDWIEPAFVASLQSALAADPRASHAYCHERLTELGLGVVWHVPEWDPVLLMVTNLHPVTCLIRRDRYEAAGGFDETMTLGYEDWDLWLRFASRGWHGVRVPRVLFNWRRHSHQTMIDDAVARHGELYRRLLENHRAFFEAHAIEAAVRANEMLRRADAHWIDDTGVPLELQYLQAVRDAYHASAGVALERRLPGVLRRVLARCMRRRLPNGIVHPASGERA
ncbi:MAG: glycosyltransferase family 2 protein [Phycisphaeraceae bacterium]|nr:glycosyltransferase family 2 protein [Phycisphaeraceae bacterium]